MTKTEVFNEIKRRGAVRAEVSFSGGNDEGGVDGIVLVRDDDSQIAPVLDPGWRRGMRLNEDTWDYEQDPEATDEDQFAGALQEPVYATYGSFAGEFYVDGTVIWDALALKVTFDGSEQNMVAEPINGEWS